MAGYEDHIAVHPVTAGTVAITLRGGAACVPRDRLEADALALEASDDVALAYAEDGAGRPVLAVLTDTLLVRRDPLEWIADEVFADASGKGRFADPETALVDIQWRLNLLGGRVRTAAGPARPRAPRTLSERLVRRRGMLGVLDVNLGDELRGALMPVVEMTWLTGSLEDASVDTTLLDLQRSPGGDGVGDLSVPADGLLGAWAIDGELRDLVETRGVREYIQRVRRVPDRALVPLIGEALASLLGITTDEERDRFDRFARLSGLDTVMWEPLHVLVVAAGDAAAQERAAALRTALGSDVEVRLVDPVDDTVTGDTEEGAQDGHTIAGDHTDWADVVVLIGAVLAEAPGTAFARTPLIADLSTTEILGWLMNTARTDARGDALVELCARADHVLVSDGAQRDVLLGALAGAGRVNDRVYDDDPSLNSLVAVDPDGSVLEDLCRRPVQAADSGEHTAVEMAQAIPKPSDLALAVQYMREGGVRNVAAKAAGRIRRVAGRKEGN